MGNQVAPEQAETPPGTPGGVDAKNPQTRSTVKLVMDRTGKVTEIRAEYGA
jgi:hypothetical protein